MLREEETFFNTGKPVCSNKCMQLPMVEHATRSQNNPAKGEGVEGQLLGKISVSEQFGASRQNQKNGGPSTTTQVRVEPVLPAHPRLGNHFFFAQKTFACNCLATARMLPNKDDSSTGGGKSEPQPYSLNNPGNPFKGGVFLYPAIDVHGAHH